jgi:hypothetical protein
MKVAISNKTDDDQYLELFTNLLKSSPRHEIGFTFSEPHDADRTFVLVDSTDEPQNEWEVTELLVSKDLLYSHPREAVHSIIKYMPQLYCIDYGVLEKK